jgi:para-nitrobenzyl esterase
MRKKFMFNLHQFCQVFLLLFLLLGTTAFLGCAKDAEQPVASAIADPIMTDKGLVSGTVIDAIQLSYYDYTGTFHYGATLVGETGKPVRVYKGIPYAAPPVGNLRWKPPQPAASWSGIRPCTTYAPMMAQYPFPQSFFYRFIPESGMSEDVLYLNVMTPAKTNLDRLPVFVFFHGGGLTSGSTSSDSYNTPLMAQQGVIWVSVQHRLGPLGFMAHPALTAESPLGASGNYGTLDLIAALQWVKKNIGAFGGDPNNVTINGQSGGGVKVNFLMASPLAKGLFHRAICQSGFSAASNTLAVAEQYGVNLATKLGVTDTGADGLAELRTKTWQEIVTAANTAPFTYSTGYTIDGWSLPDSIANIYDTGRQNDVPYMVSVASEEIQAGGYVYIPPAAIGPRMLTMSGNMSSNMYAFIFTQVPDAWRALGQTAWHGSDVSYMLGGLPTMGMFPGALVPISMPLNPGLTEKDYWVSEFMVRMLANFARTGNPNVPEMGVTWPPYKNPDQYYLDIGFRPIVQSGFNSVTTRIPSR